MPSPLAILPRRSSNAGRIASRLGSQPRKGIRAHGWRLWYFAGEGNRPQLAARWEGTGAPAASDLAALPDIAKSLGAPLGTAPRWDERSHEDPRPIQVYKWEGVPHGDGGRRGILSRVTRPGDRAPGKKEGGGLFSRLFRRDKDRKPGDKPRARAQRQRSRAQALRDRAQRMRTTGIGDSSGGVVPRFWTMGECAADMAACGNAAEVENMIHAEALSIGRLMRRAAQRSVPARSTFNGHGWRIVVNLPLLGTKSIVATWKGTGPNDSADRLFATRIASAAGARGSRSVRGDSLIWHWS